MIADVPNSILHKLIGHIFDGGWGDSFTTLKDHVLKRPMDPLRQTQKLTQWIAAVSQGP